MEFQGLVYPKNPTGIYQVEKIVTTPIPLLAQQFSIDLVPVSDVVIKSIFGQAYIVSPFASANQSDLVLVEISKPLNSGSVYNEPSAITYALGSQQSANMRFVFGKNNTGWSKCDVRLVAGSQYTISFLSMLNAAINDTYVCVLSLDYE